MKIKESIISAVDRIIGTKSTDKAHMNADKGNIGHAHIFIFISALLLLSVSVSATVPQYLNINGRLTNTTDYPQTDRFVLNFSLYTQAGGGNNIWTEIQNISVSKGQFNATLGINQSLAGVNFYQSLWLGIRVHHPTNNAEMTPRLRIATNAFAFRANTTFYVNGTAAGNIDMNSYSLFGAGWLNATNINASNWVNATAINIDAGTLFVDATNNRVGIGTISPQFVLDVRGSINSTGWVNASDINAGSIYGTFGWTNLTSYPAACPSGQAITSLGDTITCAEAGGGTNVSLNYVYNSTDWIGLRSTKDGIARIEVTSQTATDLICTDCIGTTEIEDVYLLNTGDTSTGDYTFDTTTLFIDSSNDRIGIGTTSPRSLLHVVGAGNTLNISNSTRSHLFVNGTTGKVGIGTTAPNATLHVVGDVNITGNLTVNNRSVGVDFQRFTANGTWNKPSGVTVVIIEVVGAGGGGGGARGGTDGNHARGGAGGGGALTRGIYNAADLPATLTITVGSGGSGGAGGNTANGVAGTAGSASSVNGTDFKSLTAYGGGGGGAGTSTGAGNGGGGGGGGTGSAGSNGATNNVAGNGGNPTIQGSTQGDSLGGRGASGGSVSPGNNAEFGGGGGGGAAAAGGSSLYGAGGGGSQAAGGAWGSYTAGGGGVAGTDGGSPGGAGGNGASRNFGAGDGGGGGGSSSTGAGGAGGNGGAPGGGGGGGTHTTAAAAGGNGGAGARGEVRIWAS